jgi:NitT/TauT family transport system substrate-binding protein
VRSAACLTTLAVTVAVSAACGGSGGSSASAGSSSSGGSSGGSAASGPTTVTIGYVPFTGNAPLFLGKQQGIYSKAGLDLKMVPVQAPAAAIASLVNGEQQFGFTTTIALINAVANGTDIKCVTPVDGHADPNAEYTGLFVPSSSPVQSPKDLEGKKVGIVALGSLNDLFVKYEVAKAGGDPKKVQLLQIPFPQMQAALDQGRVDAVVATAPFSNQIKAAGKSRVISWQEKDFIPNGQGTCYAASGSYIKSHGDTVKAFVKANGDALTYAKAHVPDALATLPSFLSISPDVAAKSQTGATYDSTLNVDSIKSIEDEMVKQGMLSKKPSIDSIVYSAGS